MTLSPEDLEAARSIMARVQENPEEIAKLFIAIHQAMLLECPDLLGTAMQVCIATTYRSVCGAGGPT